MAVLLEPSGVLSWLRVLVEGRGCSSQTSAVLCPVPGAQARWPFCSPLPPFPQPARGLVASVLTSGAGFAFSPEPGLSWVLPNVGWMVRLGRQLRTTGDMPDAGLPGARAQPWTRPDVMVTRGHLRREQGQPGYGCPESQAPWCLLGSPTTRVSPRL